jgi:hypothetical protein
MTHHHRALPDNASADTGDDWLALRLQREAGEPGPVDAAFTEAVLHRLPARRPRVTGRTAPSPDTASRAPAASAAAAAVVCSGLAVSAFLVGGLVLGGTLDLAGLPGADDLPSALVLGAWLALLLWWSLALLDTARPWRLLLRLAA